MKDGKLKLYVNENLLTKDLSPIPLLHSFLGSGLKGTSPYAQKTYEHGFDPNYFTLVNSASESDYIVMPYDYWQLKKSHPEVLTQIIEEANANKKPILVDASGDAFGKIYVPNSRILRINQYRFDLPTNEITVPVPCEDLLESYYDSVTAPRKKSEIATVGFVGWANISFKQRVRTLIKESPRRFLSLFDKKYAAYRKGVFWREKAVKIFQRSNKIRTNFVIRTSYSGHVRTLVGDPKKNREEFVRNIFDSDYVLIVRGDANAATRFYETLSLGRIPVFIDTACVLPLEDVISYRECCVFIDYTKLDEAPDILADFHKNLTNEQFIAMQERARYIFREYLRYDAFSKHLVRILKKSI